MMIQTLKKTFEEGDIAHIEWKHYSINKDTNTQWTISTPSSPDSKHQLIH